MGGQIGLFLQDPPSKRLWRSAGVEKERGGDGMRLAKNQASEVLLYWASLKGCPEVFTPTQGGILQPRSSL